MKKIKKSILMLALALIITLTITAQDKTEKEIKFKVFGNCNQCVDRIESALKIPEVKYSKWNKKSKMLRVIFETSIEADSLHKRVAAVGHDTEKFKAPDSVYASLPKCCLYRENPKTH
ncbi:MAG TPA: hypothetical protein PK397_11825 [Ignavibacteriaceae bacterium]|nr:hypothetical protein [Ignavibacteriaceae bacterium]